MSTTNFKRISNKKKNEILLNALLQHDLEEMKSYCDNPEFFESFNDKGLMPIAFKYGNDKIVDYMVSKGFSSYSVKPLIKGYEWDVSLFEWPTFDSKIAKIVSDEERTNMLYTIHNAGMADFQELLYWAVLYDDETIIQEIERYDVDIFSAEKVEYISGAVPYNKMKAEGRECRRELQKMVFSSCVDNWKTLRILENIIKYTGLEKVDLYPSEFYEYDSTQHCDVFNSKFCSDVLFGFFVNQTNMVERVKKWDILYAIVNQGNAAGIEYAISHEWIKTSVDNDTLMEYAIWKNTSVELKSLLLSLNKEQSKEKKIYKSGLRLEDEAKNTLSEMKKTWYFRNQDDRNIIITSYKGTDINIVIPETIGKKQVTAISPHAFDPNAPGITPMQKDTRKKIESVTFPGTIKAIPDRMFYDTFGLDKSHSSIKHIILNEGICSIGEYAFKDCDGLEEMILPESVTAIGSSAFDSCLKLRKINIPKSVTTLSRDIFTNCGFKEFQIPEWIEVFEPGVFSGCEKLKKISFPKTMVEISENMFNGCPSLCNISFPKNIHTIRKYAFAYCGIKELVIKDSMIIIEEGAFSNCKALENVQMPHSISLGSKVFSGCKRLADKNGRIIVNNILFDIVDHNQVIRKSTEAMIIPNEINRIDCELEQLPEIVCWNKEAYDEETSMYSVKNGDEITFGRFPQDRELEMKPLKWKVIEVQDDRALLITSSAIISSQWPWVENKNIWKNHPIRRLLNSGFYNVAFSDNEKKSIIAVDIDNNHLKDNVFLLSREEAERLLNSEEDMKSSATEYSYIKQREEFWSFHGSSRGEYFSYYQLRITDPNSEKVPCVSCQGYFDSLDKYDVYVYLRPSIWVSLKTN